MARKSKPKQRYTEGGSLILESPVQLDASGLDYGFFDATEDAAYVEDSEGFTHRVPVNGKGKVPMASVIQHFLDTDTSRKHGSPRNIPIDLKRKAKTVHKVPPGGFTPEEIVATGWWADPSSSDIAGIDDTTSPFMGEWGTVGKGGKTKTARIAVVGTQSERARIIKTLSDNFTDAELQSAVKGGGMLIAVGATGQKHWSGFYMRRQYGNDTPAIVLKRLDEDTITHEFVHHLRQSDPDREGLARTPYEINEIGQVRKKKGISHQSFSNLEEAATVAETTLRTRGAQFSSGYYEHLDGTEDGRSGQAAYDHDRGMLTKGKTKSFPLSGKRATDRVNAAFYDTDISHLRYTGKGARADRFARQLHEPPKEPEPPRVYAPGEWEHEGTGVWSTTGPDGRVYYMYAETWKDGTKEWWVHPANTSYVTRVKGTGFKSRKAAEAYAASLWGGA